MEVSMGRKSFVFSLFMGLLASLVVIHVYCDDSKIVGLSSRYYDQMNQMQGLKTSLFRRDLISIAHSSVTPTPSYDPQVLSTRVYHVIPYGADPTGKTDSTKALLRAISDAFVSVNDKVLMQGIKDLGGAEIHLQGGSYLISSPLRLPSSGGGNLLIHGGTLRASDDFPTNRYLIELSTSASSALSTTKVKKQSAHSSMEENLSVSSYTYEDITIKDLMLDSNYRGGGISVINSLRTTIDNCYIVHFTTNGVLVQSGHETYIRNSFLGQHITAGGDHNERNFSGTGINLMGNDNAVTDVIIFSAQIGVMVSGQANVLTGVHCYNKATGWGGTGIYLRLPGLTQTRIINCYMDYTGIVAEDPVQLHISNSFFLGDAFIVLKSIKGVINGVNIVDNMFSGSGKGIDIVQINGNFGNIDQVVIDRNNARGMNLKATVARGFTQGNETSWSVDFNRVLLFPNRIRHVQYSLSTSESFPNHALRNVSGNRVLVESNVAVPADVYVTVDQGLN